MDYNILFKPSAFEIDLMPEMKGARTAEDGMGKLFTGSDQLGKKLQEQRTPLEAEWDNARDQYDMAEYLALDENREKSIQLRDKRKHMPTALMEPERAALVLPLCYEAARMQEANLYRVARGSGSQYCEWLGQEKNDNAGADAAETYLNYQFHYQIPTPHILSDVLNYSLVEGTGWLAQWWDNATNRRCMEAINPRMLWVESVPYMDRARVAKWRRYLSLGDFLAMRDAGEVEISDADLNAAMNVVPAKSMYVDELPAVFKTARSDTALDSYRSVTLDIMFESFPKRWVYILNETVVVAVKPWLLPPDLEQDLPAGRLPFTPVAPTRRPGSIYGDSFISRMIGSQDMAASVFALLMSNLQNNSLGVPVTNNPEFKGKQLISGMWHYSPDPAGVQNVKFPDISAQLINVVEYIRNKIADPISGTTATLRGQPAYSGMPATGIRDLLNEASTRLGEMEDLVVHSMQDCFTVALLLNQRYLQPTEAFRVTGSGAIWRPGMPQEGSQMLSGQSLFGVTGKDLIPAGLPIQGGKNRMILEALNDAVVIQQTGGNPQPVMKRYIRTKYGKLVDENEVYPLNGIGNDPMQENANLKMGMPIGLDPDDNDAWHAQVHSTMQFDQEFLVLCQQNPQLWYTLLQHIQGHQSRMQQNAMMMAGVPMGGGGMMNKGFGSGSGPSGQNTSPIEPKPKTDGALDAQMGASER